LLDYKRKREQLQHCLLIADTLSKREDFQTAMLDVVAASVKTKEKDELAAQNADEEGLRSWIQNFLKCLRMG
jgi:hypothetical protein